MKILVVGFTKIKYMPYMNFYLENISMVSNDVHLLYWNRDLKEEDTSACSKVTLHEFCLKQDDDVSKFSKIDSFIKFRSYAKNLLKQENFDFIIVLHSLPGVLIYDQLKKNYKNKYILDYRDSTYEGFAPFKRIVGNLVKNSSATFVSSDAFRRFLPEREKDKIFTSHNLLMDSLSHRDEKKINGTESDKIRLAFWGFIRHEDINRELIKKVAKDTRFELHYYGREQQVALNLKKYVTEIGATNIFFHGEYKPEDRYEFVRNTDLIHNIYKDNNTLYSMGNKYYDAIIFSIPLISVGETFMAAAASGAGVGFSVDPYDEDFTEKLYKEYKNLDINEFYKNCDVELKRVLKEYNSGSEIIKNLTSC